MSAHPPPVPPENRSNKGTGSDPTPKGSADKIHPAKANPNPDQIGDPGASKQNTTNVGYQQDR